MAQLLSHILLVFLKLLLIFPFAASTWDYPRMSILLFELFLASISCFALYQFFLPLRSLGCAFYMIETTRSLLCAILLLLFWPFPTFLAIWPNGLVVFFGYHFYRSRPVSGNVSLCGRCLRFSYRHATSIFRSSPASRPVTPRWSFECSKATRKKLRRFRLYKKNSSPSNLVKFKAARARFRCTCHLARRQCFRNYASKVNSSTPLSFVYDESPLTH